ncbi:hypothetical protein ACN28G_14980 [Micromonospora sp. WMMA1923]|uniref:hypothetical protein n=1 Tax=Micromonospora sp. WMMA1923 TaxID=3404125 RepID=UPI003B93E33C
MPLHVIAVYHNTDSRFLPYEAGQALTQVISHWRHLPDTATAEKTATWIYGLFNIDLDHLENARATPAGEADFLIACTYRLLRLRSVSTGDVVAVTADGHTTWLACEAIGWKRIDVPTVVTGGPFTADTVHHHLRRGRPA